MFLSEPVGLQLASAAGGRTFGRAAAPPPGPLARLHHAAHRVDWTPDLGARIGTRDWWRGVVTLAALVAAVWSLHPEVGHPLPGGIPAPLSGEAWEEARTQAIAPLALGAASGRRMAATALVRPLAETPERPELELTATFGDGDRFTALLSRAGVSRADAKAAAALVAQAVSPDDLDPGTRITLMLGRRTDRRSPRPLERVAFRARFDLNLAVARQGTGAGTGLVLDRQPIAIDRTPLRIQGLVGASLYRSARAAGASPQLIETYLKAMATRVSIARDIASADVFDLVAERQRAATGEVRIGALQYAGLDQGRRKVELVRWEGADLDGWLGPDGTYERRGFFGMPVDGRVTSSFGLRMHPILGAFRMHKGLDIGAPYGAPIYAAMDGRVAFAGRNAGYGNFVRLDHAAGIESAYGHMSRIAVSPGMRVARGQVIGFVGSTGLSTGPHLHWEVMRRGIAVDPRSVSMSRIVALSGGAMRAFRAKFAALLAARVTAAR